MSLFCDIINMSDAIYNRRMAEKRIKNECEKDKATFYSFTENQR